MTARGTVWVVVAAAALAGCGPQPEPAIEAPPVVVAEPVPLGTSDLAPAPSAGASPAEDDTAAGEPDAAPSTAPSPATSDDDGPRSTDAAAFVTSDAVAGLGGLEHVVVDLDGDSWPEVVAAGIAEQRGVVRVAWWTAGGYEVMATDTAGPGRGVTDLRAGDVNQDGITELLVVVEGEGLRSLALWAVPGRGRLEPLAAVGGCHDGSHVYGVTSARLVARQDDPPVVVADCDESPLPVADWSEHRWVWEDGAYHHQEQFPPGPPPGRGPKDGSPGGDGEPGDGNQGRGDD